MGRAKLAMEFIKKDKPRTATFDKRKKGLKKKAYELATLCDVPLCVIIYQGPNSEPETYPSNQDEVRSVIDRYVSIPEEENAKRSLGLQEALEGKKSKVDQTSFKVQTKGLMNGYPTWFNELDGLNRDQLVKLVYDLDHKLNAVEERMGNLRGSFGIYNNNAIINSRNGCDVKMEQMSWPMFDPAAGGSSSGGGGSSAGLSYDPNEFMGSNLYHGQVGPSYENPGFGGSAVVAHPTAFYGGGGVRFEPRQMGGGGGGNGMKWFDESLFF